MWQQKFQIFYSHEVLARFHKFELCSNPILITKQRPKIRAFYMEHLLTKKNEFAISSTQSNITIIGAILWFFVKI